MSVLEEFTRSYGDTSDLLAPQEIDGARAGTECGHDLWPVFFGCAGADLKREPGSPASGPSGRDIAARARGGASGAALATLGTHGRRRRGVARFSFGQRVRRVNVRANLSDLGSAHCPDQRTFCHEYAAASRRGGASEPDPACSPAAFPRTAAGGGYQCAHTVIMPDDADVSDWHRRTPVRTGQRCWARSCASPADHSLRDRRRFHHRGAARPSPGPARAGRGCEARPGASVSDALASG